MIFEGHNETLHLTSGCLVLVHLLHSNQHVDNGGIIMSESTGAVHNDTGRYNDRDGYFGVDVHGHLNTVCSAVAIT